MRGQNADGDEPVAEQIQQCFTERRQEFHDDLHRTELDCLEARVLGIADKLTYLIRRYHVQLPELVHLLITARLCWRFADVWRGFEGRTAHEVQQWPTTLTHAADVLDAATNLLFAEWFEAHHAASTVLSHDMLEEAQEEEAVACLASAELERRSADPDSGWGPEALERLFAEAVETYNGTPRRRAQRWTKDAEQWIEDYGNRAIASRIEGVENEVLEMVREQLDTVRFLGEHGPEDLHAIPAQIRTTVALLRKAARTIGRFRWPDAVDDSGRRFFARGRRPQFATEAACARRLVDYFKADTNQPLYEHVGQLLAATFPETFGLSCQSKRPRDAVRQLLKTYPDQSTAVPINATPD